MARPKAFNRQDALGQAMEVFWTRGYEATTMTDLRKAMGIGRQSLYDTFGDKDTLFAEALDRYIAFNDGNVAATLDTEEPLEGLRALFSGRVRMLAKGFRRGCLMFNTCVEVSPHDTEVASRIESGLGTMSDAIAKSLERAKSEGLIPKGLDTQTTAAFLTTQIAGMAVMAKNGASEETLQAVADLALGILA